MGAPETFPDEAWIRTIDVNLLSVARSNRVFLPGLIAQGRGHVVNTASASGLLAYGFDRLPYVASKHAVVGTLRSIGYLLGTERRWRHLSLPVRGDHEHLGRDQSVRRGRRQLRRAPAHPLVSAEDSRAGSPPTPSRPGGSSSSPHPEVHATLCWSAPSDIESYIQASIKAQS